MKEFGGSAAAFLQYVGLCHLLDVGWADTRTVLDISLYAAIPLVPAAAAVFAGSLAHRWRQRSLAGSR